MYGLRISYLQDARGQFETTEKVVVHTFRSLKIIMLLGNRLLSSWLEYQIIILLDH